MQNKHSKCHGYRISFVHWYEIVLFWVAWKRFPLWKNQFYHVYFHSITKFYTSTSHFYWKRYNSTCESQKKKLLSCSIKTSLWETSALQRFSCFSACFSSLKTRRTPRQETKRWPSTASQAPKGTAAAHSESKGLTLFTGRKVCSLPLMEAILGNLCS